MRSAFTLIEILTAVFVFIIIIAISIPITTDFYRSYAMNAEITSLISVLRRAQSFSMVRPHEGHFGVRVENEKIILFKGEIFSERDSSFDEVHKTSYITSITGPSDIVFKPLSGSPSSSSTWIISSGSYSKTVLVNNHGVVEW